MNRDTAPNGKEVIYIDIDDEITSIIEKVTDSKQKIVALVLPKRATVLQSIVNMKLLKRSADSNNKNVVLVTTEAGLLPLAGAVGLHVAATAQSKPTIPHKPIAIHDETESVDEPPLDDTFDSQANAAKAIGVLAGAEALDETIQLDNEETPEAPPAGKAKAAKPKKGKNKKLKVPNFNSFRSRLLLGIGVLVVLIVLWVFASIVLPKASVAIKTDSEDIATTLDLTLDTTAKAVDTTKLIVPSVVEQTQKTTTQSVEASGQKNNGDKAKGAIVMTQCISSPPAPKPIPAGTGVSSGGKNYITQKQAVFSYDPSGGGSCFSFKTQSIDIVAQAGGSDYNVSSATFTVSGSSATATGSASGGTDDIIKIVNQSDIDSAKQKLAAQVDEAVKGELAGKLEDKGLFVISDSFNSGTPEVTASAKAGDQVDSVTVTQKTTYSVVGVKKADLDTLVTAAVEREIDKDKQKVLNTGVDKAKFKLQNQQNNSATVLMSMSTTSLVGPQLDENALKAQIAGKKAAEAKSLLKEYPGVTDVEIKYSPFWVSSIPSNVDKITITYEK